MWKDWQKSAPKKERLFSSFAHHILTLILFDSLSSVQNDFNFGLFLVWLQICIFCVQYKLESLSFVLSLTDWEEEQVSSPNILRLIYQGRFLHGNVTLGGELLSHTPHYHYLYHITHALFLFIIYFFFSVPNHGSDRYEVAWPILCQVYF